jgi:D-glycerate 3-kinase
MSNDTVMDALARVILGSSPRVLGISGLQGAGKSTLAATLVQQARGRGEHALAVSLDDFYLTRRERVVLARSVHPLLVTRGAPGTHDLTLMLDTLSALLDPASKWPLQVPRFDKGADDRAPRNAWQVVKEPPALLVFEGWCLGVPPQAPAALESPVNALERDEDADGHWRRYVNARLADYGQAWKLIDSLIALQAPGWDIVRRWRGEAEPSPGPATPHAMGAMALDRFLAHYERISRHALQSLPAHADVLVELDATRTPVRVTRR